MIRVKYSILNDILIKKEDLSKFIKEKYNLTENSYNHIAKSKIDRFVQTHDTKFVKQCHRNTKVFLSKNKLWLDRELVCLEEVAELNSKEATPPIKRKACKEFEHCSDRTKRRRCEELREIASEDQIKQTFISNLRKNDKTLEAKIIEQVFKLSPESKLRVYEAAQKDIKIVKYKPDEALALFIDTKMTKDQYETVSHGASIHNANIFPSYKRVLEAKKRCYPDEQFICYH